MSKKGQFIFCLGSRPNGINDRPANFFLIKSNDGRMRNPKVLGIHPANPTANFLPLSPGSKEQSETEAPRLERSSLCLQHRGIHEVLSRLTPREWPGNHRSAISPNARNVAAATCSECCVNCFSPHTRSTVHEARTGAPFFLAGENRQFRTNEAASPPHIGPVTCLTTMSTG